MLYFIVMTKQAWPASMTEPFFFPGGEPGVLLIHGFLTAPGEMRPLGEHLAAAGMTVSGIRLRGHGTKPEDLARASWQEWLADVEAGLAELQRHCTRICVAGLSLGGALALHAAAHNPVKRVVTFSAPDSKLAHHPLLELAKAGARIARFVPKIGSDVRDPEARRGHFTYTKIPLRSVRQIMALMETIDAQLPHITAPTLLVQARHDLVVPQQTPQRIAARLGGPSRIFWVERGGHTVVMDYDREIVFAQTRTWLSDSGDAARSMHRAT
jgi:carboxylesterase